MVGSEANWRAMVDFNREAQELKDKILSEEICEPARASVGPDLVRHRTSKCDDGWYVFSCNVDADPLEKVTFELPHDAPRAGTVEVLYENRTLQAKGGVFSDAFDGFSRHIYRIVK